jgi:hypothetical protein
MSFQSLVALHGPSMREDGASEAFSMVRFLKLKGAQVHKVRRSAPLLNCEKQNPGMAVAEKHHSFTTSNACQAIAVTLSIFSQCSFPDVDCISNIPNNLMSMFNY